MTKNFYSKCLLYICILSGTATYAQIDPPCLIPGAFLCDNIDAYTAGDALGPGASWWTTWSGAEGGAEDGTVSDDEAYSGSNSVLIPEGGTTDVILKLGNQTTGSWRLEWQMYVPSGSMGYYNVQESETPGIGWNLEVYFGDIVEGEGEFTVPLGPSFTYPVDQWFLVQHIINLDDNTIEVYIDDVLVLDDAYMGNLGGIDFYSAGADNHYYVDDVLLTDVLVDPCAIPGAALCDNIDTYPVDMPLGPNADWWSTWSGTEGGAEDGTVVDDFAVSGSNSVYISGNNTTDVLLKLGNLTSGAWRLQWQMYVPDEAHGYYNIQESETPGIAWNVEVLFGLSDIGVPAPSGEGTVSIPDFYPFIFPVDEWFLVEHIIDLDANEIELYINGELVYADTYAGSLGAIDFYSVDGDNTYYLDDILLIDNSLLVPYYLDADDDGYGDPGMMLLVAGDPPAGYVDNSDDCDDTNEDINPDATEICNDIDDNCDGEIDEGLLTTYFADADDDSFGDADAMDEACSMPAGYVENSADCDDTNPDIYPGAPEVVNGVDDDCDGLTDESIAIDDIWSLNSIHIYPVPSAGLFTLDLNAIATGEKLQLEIFDSFGQMIYTDEIVLSNNQITKLINLEQFASGVYQMHLISGDTVISKQLMIQR